MGGYPNEFLIYESFRNHKVGEVPVSFYLYIIGMIAVAAIGMIFQFNERKYYKDLYNYRNYDFKYRRA